MRKLILLSAIIALFAIPLYSAYGATMLPDTAKVVKDGPVLKLEAQAVNMGTFQESETSERTVKFTNTGNRALIIHQVFSDCGCTVPTYTKDSIAPGESGEIKVLFKGKGRPPGDFRKVLRIRSNALNNREILMVEGRISRSYLRKK